MINDCHNFSLTRIKYPSKAIANNARPATVMRKEYNVDKNPVWPSIRFGFNRKKKGATNTPMPNRMEVNPTLKTSETPAILPAVIAESATGGSKKDKSPT